MRRLTVPACCLVPLSAFPAGADVTPEDVWAALVEQLSLQGEVTADTVRSGDRLTASNVTIVGNSGNIDTTVRFNEPFVFRDLGNGTVATEIATSMTVPFSTITPDGQTISGEYQLTQTGMKIIASGEPDNILQQISAETIAYQLSDLQSPADGTVVSLAATLSNLAGNWRVAGEAPRKLTSEYGVQAVALAVSVDVADDAVSVDVDTSLENVAVKLDYTQAGLGPDADDKELFNAGFAVNLATSTTGSSFAVNGDTEGRTMIVSGQAGPGQSNISVSKDGLQMTSRSEGIVMSGAVADLPFPPVEMRLSNTETILTMPLVETQTPQPFRFRTKLDGLQVSDFLWSLVDPTAQLPRDPASLTVDLEGAGRWLVNFLDEGALLALQGTPFLPSSVALSALELEVAGASLTGSGGVTFDTPEGGFPQPSGSVDLSLTGGFGLLDKLAAIGLVPQQAAQGIKAVSGIFAQRGDGPDSLTSTIRLEKDGSITANGVPIQ